MKKQTKRRTKKEPATESAIPAEISMTDGEGRLVTIYNRPPEIGERGLYVPVETPFDQAMHTVMAYGHDWSDVDDQYGWFKASALDFAGLYTITVETVPEPEFGYTKQETFDIVARHLLTQNKRAVNPYSSACCYLTDDGCKCAAGCLIPPYRYDPMIEGLGVDSGIVSKIVVDEGHAVGLVANLQRLHDDTPVGNWPEELRARARDHGLSAAVVDELRPAAVLETENAQ